jgi:hypothetical protein
MPSHQPDVPSIVSDNNDDEIFRPKKKRLDPRLMLSGIMMFILVSSSGLALVAQNRDTDNRSSASEGELSALAVAEPCVETPGNLIKNPSFENNFNGWRKGRNIKSTIATNKPPHCKKMTKSIFLKPEGSSDALTQSLSRPIVIKPNTQYKISFWARTNTIDPDASNLIAAEVLEDFGIAQGPEVRLSFNLNDYFWPTQEWQKFESIAFSQSSFSSAASRFYIWMEGQKGSAIFIDNIVLTEIPEPTPTIEPTPTASQSAQKRVFVTSTTYDGNLGGTDGADAKCQESADMAGLNGEWIAWLSTEQNNVRDRLDKNSNGYALLNGTNITDAWNYASTTKINHPININEYGNIVSDLPHEMEVWTNTYAWGSYIASGETSCNNFTTNSSEMKGLGGSIGLTWEWTGVFGKTCNVSNHLYCFEK